MQYSVAPVCIRRHCEVYHANYASRSAYVAWGEGLTADAFVQQWLNPSPGGQVVACFGFTGQLIRINVAVTVTGLWQETGVFLVAFSLLSRDG